MRVLIVEDGGFITDALLSLLGLLPEITVVGTVTNASDAIEATCRTRPDLVILDMRIGAAPDQGLPAEKHGLTALRRLQAVKPAPRVLVFSSLPEHPWLHIIAEAGALGFVHKDESSAALITAIQSLRSGGVAFTSSQLRLLQQPRLMLSKREREVLLLLEEGLGNKEIADRLGISAGTVRKHVENLCNLFGVHSRGQVVAAARRSGALTPDP